MARGRQAARDRIIGEEPLAVVVAERDVERQFFDPSWEWGRTIEMHLAYLLGEVVADALDVKRRAPPNNEWDFEQGLQRDDHKFPT